jgi:hypothetical protein
MHSLLVRGIGLFNPGDFFEAHEVLEEIWTCVSRKRKEVLAGINSNCGRISSSLGRQYERSPLTARSRNPHDDWRVRQSALDIVSWGVGATDGIETSIKILTHDPDEDVRAFASLALYEAGRGSPELNRIIEEFKRVAESDVSDYVRDSVSRYLLKLTQRTDPNG